MKKVTIINAYGDKNIGDAAILTVAIDFIKQAYKKDCKISILCENENSIKKSLASEKNISAFQLPYGYAIRSRHKKASMKVKAARFVSISLFSLGIIGLNLLLKTKLIRSGFYSYIAAIKDADIVIGMGGGYIIAQSTKDYFGLFLTLLPVYIAKIYKKKIIFLPLSFGPFANKNQEWLSYQAIKNTAVMVRDQITFKKIKSLDRDKKVKLSYAPDLALFFKPLSNNTSNKLKSNYITLTAREWFPEKIKQQEYENTLKELIEYVWKKHQLRTIFIPMASNSIEDDDNEVANRLIKSLRNKEIFKIIQPKDPLHVQRIFANAKLAVCTRMHSAILASTVHTPFIAIGYGHKTLGLVQILGLEKWHIDINKVNTEILIQLFRNLMRKDNYISFLKTVEKQQANNFSYKNMIVKSISA